MLLNAGVIGASAGGGAWTPANITTVLWLDASDAATITKSIDDLIEIQDKSGNLDHAAPPETSARPKHGTVTLNGKPIIKFDGSNDVLRGDFSGSASDTVIVVERMLSFSSFGRRVVLADSSDALSLSNTSISGQVLLARGTPSIGSGTARLHPYTEWGVLAGYHPNQSLSETFRINGVNPPVTSTTSSLVIGNTPINSYSIGARWDQAFSALEFAELIVIPGAASLSTIQKTEGYLAHKWGLTANLPSGHPYRTVAP